MKTVLRSWLLLAWIQLCVALPGAAQAHPHKYLLFVGTYTAADGKDTGSKGIYSYRFNGSSGKVVPTGVAAETVNPSFLVAAPNKRFVYAVNELQKYEGE